MPYQHPDSRRELQGIVFTVGACALFGIIPFYLQLLAPLSGNLLFAHRILAQLLFAVLIIGFTGNFRRLLAVFSSPSKLKGVLLSTFLISFQWWVFFWAPVNGHTVDVAIGYFILPLTVSLMGRLFFAETMRPTQWFALGLALSGVVIELFISGRFSWITLLVCVGYPPYFWVRRKFPLDTRINFTAENILLTPLALLLLIVTIQNGEPWLPARDHGLLYLAGAGLLGTVPMLLFVAASARLPFTVFGMLSYLEPILLILVAVFILNEPVAIEKVASYSFFALAVICTLYDSAQRLRTNTVV